MYFMAQDEVIAIWGFCYEVKKNSLFGDHICPPIFPSVCPPVCWIFIEFSVKIFYPSDREFSENCFQVRTSRKSVKEFIHVLSFFLSWPDLLKLAVEVFHVILVNSLQFRDSRWGERPVFTWEYEGNFALFSIFYLFWIKCHSGHVYKKFIFWFWVP